LDDAYSDLIVAEENFGKNTQRKNYKGEY